MKVLMVSGIFPPDIGGPATYVPAMATALVERGHELAVVTLSEARVHDQAYPFRVVRLQRQQFKPWRMLQTFWTILQLGRQVDVLFVNGLAFESVIANLVLRKPMIQKVVGDIAWERARGSGRTHDDFETFQRTRYSGRLRFLKWSRAIWTSRATIVLVPSQYLAYWIEQWCVPRRRIRVVYNAVKPLDDVQPAEIPLPTAVNVVTVGRLVPWKHMDKVIEAIARVPEAGLVIIGDGPERQSLVALSRSRDIAERVYFAGQRSQMETHGLMAACDVFVLNSSYEGLPHIVLEAMQLGLPAVATAAGGTREVVRDGETGMLVAVDDTEALFAAVRHLVRDRSLREAMSDAAGKFVRQQFGFGPMVTQTEALLAELVEERRKQ